MKTDIEIAQEAEMMPIKNVAEQLGITEDDIELYGKYKAKISNEYYEKIKDNEDGKLLSYLTDQKLLQVQLLQLFFLHRQELG